jgi:hypothetical protein
LTGAPPSGTMPVRATVEATHVPGEAEAPPAPSDPLSLRVFEAAVTAPTLGVVVYGLVRRPGAFGTGLLLWMILIAAIDLLPVTTWRGIQRERDAR